MFPHYKNNDDLHMRLEQFPEPSLGGGGGGSLQKAKRMVLSICEEDRVGW